MNKVSSALSPTSTSSKSSVFEGGKHETVLNRGDPDRSSLSPPKPLLIASPAEEGEYPVLLLLHGYLLYNTFYSQLCAHIASHGFVVVAPQLYSVAGPDATEEIRSTAAITNWLPKGLRTYLPPMVRPSLTKVALSGHSRGGKVAFALALRKVTAQLDLEISALIGIDPVDGMDRGKQTPPPVLTYIPRSFSPGIASMVIGSGLGSVPRNPLFPPCAPKGVNHEDFYDECGGRSWHFVVKDCGHLDMLDDDTKGIRGRATYCLCKNGERRDPMRRFVGGAVVAFLRAYLEGDSTDLTGITDGSILLPVVLQKIDHRA